MRHRPVLLKEVVDGLDLQPGQTIVDATINRGGHARELCQKIVGGRLIGVDADNLALAEAKENLSGCPCAVDLIAGNFGQMAQLLGDRPVNAFLFDLGWSSEQIMYSGRGFSFQVDEPLLMTYSSDPINNLTATEIVNGWSEQHLVEILREYGDEHFAPKIAKAIVEARRHRPINRTSQLVALVKSAVPSWYTHRRLHFATKTFQALRIATNDEFGAITQSLPIAWKHLVKDGRLAVISFHSGEARIIKNIFRSWTSAEEGKLITKHAVKPTRAEILDNPRARSAQLRIIKKN